MQKYSASFKANPCPYYSIHEDQLYLKVNKDKTVVAHVKDVNLGHRFYTIKGKGLLRVHPKSIIKMKEKIKALTSRSNGWGNERRKKHLDSISLVG